MKNMEQHDGILHIPDETNSNDNVTKEGDGIINILVEEGSACYDIKKMMALLTFLLKKT